MRRAGICIYVTATVFRAQIHAATPHITKASQPRNAMASGFRLATGTKSFGAGADLVTGACWMAEGKLPAVSGPVPGSELRPPGMPRLSPPRPERPEDGVSDVSTEANPRSNSC